MALTNIWKIHSIEYVDPTPGTPLDAGNVFIGAISNATMPVRANVTRDTVGSKVFPTSGRIDFTSVDVELTTFAADKLIDLVGVGGFCIPSGASLLVYIARHECAGPAAGAVHRYYAVNKGMVYLTNLQCDHKGDLQATFRIQAVFDGTNSAVVQTDSVALPSSVLLGDESVRWTLHDSSKTTINSVAAGSKRSVSVDFGVNTSTEGADSDPFDTFASIDQIQPVVSVSGVDPTWLSTILPLDGAGVAHASTSIPFRKRSGSGFVADGTAQHIIMTANGLAYFDQLFNASSNEAGTTSLRIETTEDTSGTAPVVLNTAVAIP